MQTAEGNGIESGQPGGPCVMVVFGAGGDLAKRKLFPAIYNLAKDKLLPKDFAIVGFGRTVGSTEEFRKRVSEELPQFATSEVDPELLAWLVERIYVQIGTFEDSSAFEGLQTLLSRVDKDHGTNRNYFYYLATAPRFFAEIVHRLGAAGLTNEENGQWRRVIIEKPFGRDLESARALNGNIAKTLKESQIYRIDHYLGKETVQNILAFRFGNGIF